MSLASCLLMRGVGVSRSMRLKSVVEEPEQMRLPMLGERGVGVKVRCAASKWGQWRLMQFM